MDVQIPCPCPQKDGEPRHESDTVTLREVFDFHQATTITKAAALQVELSDDPDSQTAVVLATLSEYYVLMGVERWTLRNASNQPARGRIIQDELPDGRGRAGVPGRGQAV